MRPVSSRSVALIDDVQLIHLFVEAASREFSLRLRAGDTLLLRVGDTEPRALLFAASLAEGQRIRAVFETAFQVTFDFSLKPVVDAMSIVILVVSDAVSFLEQVNRDRRVRIVTHKAQAPT